MSGWVKVRTGFAGLLIIQKECTKEGLNIARNFASIVLSLTAPNNQSKNQPKKLIDS
jgi:hypothetical protein